MLYILTFCAPFKLRCTIIELISFFMIYFWFVFGIWNKMSGNKTVHEICFNFSILVKLNNRVSSISTKSHYSILAGFSIVYSFYSPHIGNHV